MQPRRTYWLDLFTYSTWQQFLDSGASVTGFREGRWRTVKQIKPGDYLLCYLTGVSRWIGLLEATSEGYFDEAPIWKEAVFPARVKVKTLVALTPKTAVPVFELREKLSIFKHLHNPNAWTGHFRGSPAKWKPEDGKAVVDVLFYAKANPSERPVDIRKLHKMPPVLQAKSGLVTVPEDGSRDEPPPAPANGVSEPAPQGDSTSHTEIQWLLLKLGNDMGLDLWVARNDKGK